MSETFETVDNRGLTISIVRNGGGGGSMKEFCSRVIAIQDIGGLGYTFNPARLPDDRLDEYKDPRWIKDYTRALKRLG